MISIFVKSFGIQRLIRFYLDRAAASNMLHGRLWRARNRCLRREQGNESQRRHSLVCDASEPSTLEFDALKCFYFYFSSHFRALNAEHD